MTTGDPSDPLNISLSAREIEIIELVAEGLTCSGEPEWARLTLNHLLGQTVR